MRKSLLTRRLLVLSAAMFALFGAGQNVQAQFNLTSSNYTQNFDALGTTTLNNITDRNLNNVSTSLNGWYFFESGTGANSNIVVGTGTGTGGDTYNFGATGNTDRSLGGLQSGSVTPSWGFWFSNSLGATITNLSISYLGETWRVGATGRSDALLFGFSGSASSLTGSFTNSPALGYTNVATNATGSGSLLQSATISNNLSVSIASGSTFFIRWTDFDASGSDDGMSIDNFSLTAFIQAVIAALNWSGGSGIWSTGFSGAVTDGSALSFSGGGGIATNDLSSPKIVSMTFSNSAGSYTIAGNSFTISNGIVNNSVSAQTFSNAITLGAAQTFDAAAGDMTFAGDINNNGNVLTVSGASNTVISGIVSGSAGLTKSGLGTLTLGGVNTFVGGISLNGGTLSVGADSNLGDAANAITFGGGTLATTASFATARSFSGSGALNVAAGTTLTNAGTINMTSLALTNTGTFEMSGASKTINGLTFNNASVLTNTGAAAVLGGNVTANNTSGTVVMAGAYDLGTTNRTFTVNDGSAAVDMQLTGAITNTNPAALIIKAGTGRLEITGVNTGMAGGVRLGTAGSAPAGSILINNKNALGSAQFRLDSGTLESSVALTGADAITNALRIGGIAAGPSILGGSNPIEFTGPVTWFTGGNGVPNILLISNQSTLSGVIESASFNTGVQLHLGGNGTLTLGGASANTFTNTLIISNTGLTVVAAKDGALGTTAGSTTLQSGSTLLISNINYSTAEALGISGAGVGGDGALRSAGTSTYAGAITAAANATIAADAGSDFTLNGALNGGGNTITAGGAGNLLLAGAVSNGNLAKTGAGILTISNASSSFGTLTTGTGETAVRANATVTGLAGSGSLNLAGGTLTVNNSTAQTFGGSISGAAALLKTGTGSLTLSGNSTFTGSTTVTNGTLVVNGDLSGSSVSVGNASVVNGSVLMGSGSVGATTIDTRGRISPGNSVGALSVSNSLSFNSGGSYLWEINGTNGPAGTAWDLLTVDTTSRGDGLGTLNLPGSGQFTINGLAIDGFVFDGGQSYTNDFFLIVKAAGITGSLANLSFLGTGLGSGSWTFSTNSTGLFANYSAPSAVINFTNTGTASQGDADIATPAGPWGLIDQDYAVEVTGGGTVIMTNASNSYSGTTTIKNGTLQANVDALNNANGAFGNAITAIAVGNNTGSASANLDIGADGVTIGRAVNVVAGSSGTKTVGTSLTSGAATYSGNLILGDSATLTAGGTANAVFSGIVSGSGGLTKSGLGTVTLSGAAGNSFTGATTVSAGTLLLSKSSGNALATNVAVNTGGALLLGSSNQISDTATVTLGGGTFDLASFDDTIGTLQLNSGTVTGNGGTLTATIYNLAGGSLAANLGTGTINATGSVVVSGTVGATTLNIAGSTLTLGSAGRLSGTAPTVNLSGGASLVLGGNESIGALNLTNGTVSGSGILSVATGISAQQGTLSANLGGNAGLTKTTASTVLLSGVNTFSGAVAVNAGALALTNGNALSDAAAVTLANVSGAVLRVDQNETIGSLAGGGATGGEVSLGTNSLSLNQAGNTTYTGTVTGTGTLSKTGTGTLTLNRTTGIGTDFDLSISGGAVDLNRAGSALSGILGSSNKVALAGGTLSLSASSGGNGDITFAGIDVLTNSTVLINRTSTAANHSSTINAPLTFSNNAVLSMAYGANVSGGTTTFSGTAGNTLYSDGTLGLGAYAVNISTAIGESGGSFSFTKTGAGTLTLSASNTYTGPTIIREGTVSLSGSGRIADASLLVVSNGATMNLNNISDTVKGVSGAGLVTLGSGGLTTANTGTDSFSGIISGTGAYTKAGAGTQIFSGANTYTGSTTITAGALIVNGNQSAATNAVSVGGGSVLGGSGKIGGAVAVSGTLAPGSSIESLGTGALSFSNGSTFAVELNSGVAASVGADLVVASGNLSLANPGTITLTLTDLAVSPAAFALGTKFSLINYSGSWNNGLFTFGPGALADGATFDFGLNTWQIDYNATTGGANFTGDYLPSGNFVNIEAVPEPSTYALLALAAAGLGAHLIRRRRR